MRHRGVQLCHRYDGAQTARVSAPDAAQPREPLSAHGGVIQNRRRGVGRVGVRVKNEMNTREC